MEKQSTELNIAVEKRKYVVGLILAVAAVNGFVSLIMGSDTNYVYFDILRIVTIASASVLSIVVFGKQGSKGLFGRAYTGLAVGLAMWLIAESVWGYYEVVLGEETPFPSIADVFWLGAYGGLLYYVSSMYKFFGKGVKKYQLAAVVGIIGGFAFFYLQSLISVSLPPDGESMDGYIIPLAISVAYPVLDVILMVPAILIVLNSGKGHLTSIPWAFVSFILVAIADILLGYSAVTGFQNDVTIITMMYNASYLCMAAGLLWYLRFFISERKQVFKS
jgi:branched-chain amino acid transport system substrate-binding protein